MTAVYDQIDKRLTDAIDYLMDRRVELAASPDFRGFYGNIDVAITSLTSFQCHLMIADKQYQRVADMMNRYINNLDAPGRALYRSGI